MNSIINRTVLHYKSINLLEREKKEVLGCLARFIVDAAFKLSACCDHNYTNIGATRSVGNLIYVELLEDFREIRESDSKK